MVLLVEDLQLVDEPRVVVADLWEAQALALGVAMIVAVPRLRKNAVAELRADVLEVPHQAVEHAVPSLGAVGAPERLNQRQAVLVILGCPPAVELGGVVDPPQDVGRVAPDDLGEEGEVGGGPRGR